LKYKDRHSISKDIKICFKKYLMENMLLEV